MLIIEARFVLEQILSNAEIFFPRVRIGRREIRWALLIGESALEQCTTYDELG